MSHADSDDAHAAPARATSHSRVGHSASDDDGSGEREPLLGYESDVQAIEDMHHDDEVLTDLNHGGV